MSVTIYAYRNFTFNVNPNDLRRTDLLFYGLGANSSKLYTDLSVGHPCGQGNVGHACHTPGYTLQDINQRKRSKYEDSCALLMADFCPLAFETFGKASKEVHHLLRVLTAKASDNLHVIFHTQSALLSYWKRRLSTTLQIENVSHIMRSSALILSKTDIHDNTFGINLDELELESVHVP